ncbi:MAG TPA: TonB-dependent receptor [bacterium]|nr:TonB-dependent receptor [bacterium]HPN43538.1 TonB-dependent receptor [bacterium]
MQLQHFNLRRIIPVFVALILIYATLLPAQTRSRIAGTVIDAESGEPLPGVNIIIEGTSLGAASGINGQYVIVNVPVGTYRLRATMMGYEGQVITDVMVSLDRLTRIDFRLVPTVIQGSEVVVIAKKDELHKEVSNTQLVVNDVQLQDASGIREINAFLTKLPGVSEENGFLTIRGGSADQTGMMVNGMSYFNAAAGNAETSIPLSAIEQVSLMSGGYNAEYGNFRSGLINVTTKSGDKSGYHGTFSYSRDQMHIRRFGDSFYDTNNPVLKPFLDPAVAFTGTDVAWKDDPYKLEQYPRFTGWNAAAETFNKGKAPEDQCTPLDYYLLACWMHMTEPDYKGLEKLGYTVSEEQKKLFAEHHMEEENADWNFDGGFGGPVPLVGDMLGGATFYLSHNARERNYIMPVVRSSDENYTTLLTVKSQPMKNLSVTLNGLHKRQFGVSPIRPAFGDFPDAGREGGFMPINNIKYVYANPEYWYDPPFFPLLDQTTVMTGVTINHVLNSSTFWELTLSAMNIKDHSPVGDNRNQTVITRFGPFAVTEMPYGKMQYGTNTVDGYTYPSYDALPGISRRFRRKEGDLYDNIKVGQYRAKFDIASQVNLHHYLKGGFEYNYIDLNHKFWEKWNENYYNVYEFNYHRTPSQTGFYLQDQISLEAIVANLGLRLDYYYGGGGKWPTGDAFAVDAFTPQTVESDSVLFHYLEQGRSYIWDTWVAYDKEHPGFLQPVKNHFTVSPRIGISFPITAQSKFYFNYGHFRSNPPYYTMYLYRYRYTKNGLYDMSNPNLAPPRTISYELGTAYNFYENYVLRIAGYSKDVTGQHGQVTYQNADGSIDYDAWANNEYEDIQGVEINLAKNDNSWLTGWINFNYILKKSGLTGRDIITEVTINNDQEGLYSGQESRSLPVPKLNANVTFRTPRHWGPDVFGGSVLGNWNMTLFAEWERGDYFTWNPLNELHLNNNLRWPDYFMIDLKLTKTFQVGGLATTFFVDISNLFNFKVSLMEKGWCFNEDAGDDIKYFSSLRLPMYASSRYDDLRAKNPGYYIAGNDQVGDLRSKDKPYINDPNYPFWLYGEPRDIWFGLRFSF